MQRFLAKYQIAEMQHIEHGINFHLNLLYA